MSVPNREGKTYRHRQNDALVVVIKTERMSAGTARHTLLILDPANAINPRTGKPRMAGDQEMFDEVPVQKWSNFWEDV